VAESARAGLRELDRLSDAAQRGATLTTSLDRRSRLAEVLDAVLRTPALTPKALARQLRITPQAATRLLATLAEAGIVAEITGRKSFRAFAVMATLSPPVAGHASPAN
jgi:DNA-binding MarR family transcriptional regulator